MGRSVSGNLTMKLLLVCVAAITISTSSAKWTCEACTAVVNSMSAYLTSEEHTSTQHQHYSILATAPWQPSSRSQEDHQHIHQHSQPVGRHQSTGCQSACAGTPRR